eukprot:TRINITY_DN2450_c0_g1_i1.p1 TRINITY_DN2450_c0_g1~~TRINITY_DN2450_c0_g1_i1.p1  ORF type:complete len:350 (-),score=75.24 TRINITY_DN2450_c0_g1_i1:121-1170(-)
MSNSSEMSVKHSCSQESSCECHHQLPDVQHEQIVLEEGDEELMEELIGFLPPQIKALPEEQQKIHLYRLLKRFKEQEKAEEEMKQAEQKRKAFIKQNYVPLHPSIYTVSSSFFTPSFLELVSYVKQNKSLPSDSNLITTVSQGERLYSFQMFSTEFCTKFLEEADYFQKWSQQSELLIQRPNSMNNYGVILNEFGWEETLQQMINEYLSPLTSILFSDLGGSSLDSHHSFLVEYEIGKDEKLDFHVDDSEVTLNVCLGKKFTGGELFFKGIRCELHQHTPSAEKENMSFAHVVGMGLLHVGRHRHGATPISSGHRTNLIIWCRSQSFRDQLMKTDPNICPSWCSFDKLS